jgi:hypothetical protein
MLAAISTTMVRALRADLLRHHFAEPAQQNARTAGAPRDVIPRISPFVPGLLGRVFDAL